MNLNVFISKIHLISLTKGWGWNRENEGSRNPASPLMHHAVGLADRETVIACQKNCVRIVNVQAHNNHGNREL